MVKYKKIYVSESQVFDNDLDLATDRNGAEEYLNKRAVLEAVEAKIGEVTRRFERYERLFGITEAKKLCPELEAYNAIVKMIGVM